MLDRAESVALFGVPRKMQQNPGAVSASRGKEIGMPYHDRRRKVAIGISLIEQAIADALREAEDNGRTGLSRAEIRDLIGLPDTEDWWSTIRYFLGAMMIAGEVVNDNRGPGRDMWRLSRGGDV